MSAAEVALKPCPFCGGKANVTGLGPHSSVWVVACGHCFARLDARTRSEAIAAWNRRAPERNPDNG